MNSKTRYPRTLRLPLAVRVGIQVAQDRKAAKAGPVTLETVDKLQRVEMVETHLIPQRATRILLTLALITTAPQKAIRLEETKELLAIIAAAPRRMVELIAMKLEAIREVKICSREVGGEASF